MRGHDSEVLMQLFLHGPTWDGNLISKTGRDELVREDLADTSDGWNFLTAAGVDAAVEYERTHAKAWVNQSWYRKATCR